VPKFGQRFMTLADAFGTSTVTVKKPQTLCDATGVDGAPIQDPNAALVCYRTKDPVRFTPRDVAVTNAFGAETLTAVKATSVCVPSTLP